MTTVAPAAHPAPTGTLLLDELLDDDVVMTDDVDVVITGVDDVTMFVVAIDVDTLVLPVP
jgi:hypothetical protein